MYIRTLRKDSLGQRSAALVRILPPSDSKSLFFGPILSHFRLPAFSSAIRSDLPSCRLSQQCEARTRATRQDCKIDVPPQNIFSFLSLWTTTLPSSLAH